MKLFKPLFLLFLLTAFSKSYTQNLFPEKFDNCNTDHFSLESDTITAKIQDEQLLNIFKQSFDQKTIDKLRGNLSLQIIVDLEGNSCLISLKNETNIKSKKLNLKQNIDSNLKWDKPQKKVAAIIVFIFEENRLKFLRLGINAKKGVHELSEN